MNKTIFCIDLKAFYASIECVERNLDVLTANLAVVDIGRSKNSICLSISNNLKKIGINSRCRYIELPKNLNIIFAKPRMNKYIEISCKIIEIFLKYVSYEDLHIYSIDEAFLDVTKYLKMNKMNDVEMARTILNEIYEKTKLVATCGISYNLFMAKCCLDNDAKNNKNNGYISKWSEKDIKEKLWKIKPLSKIWGIGKNQEKKLNECGILTIENLANYDVNLLKKKFGIIGEELYLHANGIDYSTISEYKNLDKDKSLSIGATLDRSYSKYEIDIVIKDSIELLCERLRKKKKIGNVVSLSILYDDKSGGLSGTIKINNYTQDKRDIYKYCIEILNSKYNGSNFRKINISLGNLIDSQFLECSIFESLEDKHKDKMINETIDNINKKYLNNTIYYARNKLKNSTYLDRKKLTGGHNAE